MICLSSSAIMVIASDGTKIKFEPEELQSRLIRSCLESGIKDYWLAEDLTNAVENALKFQSESGVVFSESEINSFLTKILEDAGYPNVAENFRNKSSLTTENITLSQDNLKKLLKTQLGLKNEDSIKLTEKILNACDTLAIETASPTLLLELARHYKRFDNTIPKLQKPQIQSIKGTPWLLTVPEIIPLLSQNTKQLVNSRLIEVSGISRLFPSLKMSLRLEGLAQHYELKPIITELTLFPYFDLLINGINEIITRVNRHLEANNEDHQKKLLPVYLRFSDIYRFSKTYLGVSFPGGEKFCRDIAVSLAENLKYPVSIKGVKRS